MSETANWIQSLKPAILEFLSKLRHPDHPGFYSYSLTGDIYSPRLHWGLGNSVFAAKIYYMLDSLNGTDARELTEFIKSFQVESGEIYDPLIKRKSFPRRLFYSARNLNLDNFFNEQTKRAETRQAFAALRCLNSKPDIPYKYVPYTKKDIKKYILSLDWQQPWGAGSHVSHLLFFLNNNRLLFDMHQDDTNSLIDYALQTTNQYQQKDGSWYSPTTNLPSYQKINGAMKIMTAYDAAERNNFANPEGLIDLCLSNINDGHACNNFNIVCVLYHCCRKTGYRRPEVENYFIERLRLYKEHYWPEHGGFSFFRRKSNDIYYAARISKGLPEPDIHGTVLFLWGIVLIADFLNIRDKFGLKIPIT